MDVVEDVYGAVVVVVPVLLVVGVVPLVGAVLVDPADDVLAGVVTGVGATLTTWLRL